MSEPYNPFLDDGQVPLDVTKWPARKPVPDTVQKWEEESDSDGTVQTKKDSTTKET